jgi:pimeloyl-ACP methyl ester carboxylesterase
LVEKDKLAFLDKSIINQRVFYPQTLNNYGKDSSSRFTLFFQVDEKTQISALFHKSSEAAPIILFFHGNGELATDYDYIAKNYTSRLNLCIVEYRGYGLSDGSPSFSTMISDSHKIFSHFKNYISKHGFTGPLVIMGRSLGSASAIELASSYQDDIAALIIESGFADTFGLFFKLGIPKNLLSEVDERDISPLPLMEKILKPTLVIHGEIDFIIPVKDAYSLHNACPSENKKLVIIPRAGHNDIMNFPIYMKSLFEFLTTYEIL